MKALLTMTMLAAAATSAAGASAGEAVTYSAEGREFEGYLARAEAPKGTVVIIHDWDGLTDYEKQRADMLAAMGYTAFAVDIYGKGVRPTTPDANKAETQKLYGDRPLMVRLLNAGVAQAPALQAGPAVVIGYCFGGSATLELAADQPDGVVGYAAFHPSAAPVKDNDYSAAKVPLRIYHGSADPAAPIADMAALTEALTTAGTPFRTMTFGGVRHTFTVPGSKDYDAAADAASWSDFSTLLAEVMS